MGPHRAVTDIEGQVYMRILLLVALTLAGCSGSSRAPRDPARAGATNEGRLGTVQFPVSCAPLVRPAMDSGLALLHNMTYEAAAEAFARAARMDSSCAMAYWGQAMTFIHPLWNDPPTAATFARGRDLIARARGIGNLPPKEVAFLQAAVEYYDVGRQASEAANIAAFERGWERVHRLFPDDVEATAFYALAHLATADPSDKGYSHQRTAGGLMEGVLARFPDHPAAHHYLIHAYDAPSLAERGLETARHYGAVAPDVAHALHMPTHTFTRLGRWDESISWNLRSAEAARANPVGAAISLHYLHALDYLAYAYLQTGEELRAESVAATVAGLQGPFMAEIAVPYTLAAVPARLALERRRWADAVALVPRQPANFPWDQFPAVEALTHFARALGAAHTNDSALARQSITRLKELREASRAMSPYWAGQVDIQVIAAQAWLDWSRGDDSVALAGMRRSAELEAGTEKHPVTPGELLPSRELLADLLLAMGRPAEALAEYETSLKRSPGRRNAVYGAARAAQLAGDTAAADRNYRNLTALTADSGGEDFRVRAAREWLGARPVAP